MDLDFFNDFFRFVKMDSYGFGFIYDFFRFVKMDSYGFGFIYDFLDLCKTILLVLFWIFLNEGWGVYVGRWENW